MFSITTCDILYFLAILQSTNFLDKRKWALTLSLSLSYTKIRQFWNPWNTFNKVTDTDSPFPFIFLLLQVNLKIFETNLSATKHLSKGNKKENAKSGSVALLEIFQELRTCLLFSFNLETHALKLALGFRKNNVNLKIYHFSKNITKIEKIQEQNVFLYQFHISCANFTEIDSQKKKESTLPHINFQRKKSWSLFALPPLDLL